MRCRTAFCTRIGRWSVFDQSKRSPRGSTASSRMQPWTSVVAGRVRDADSLPETLSVPQFDPSERSELRGRLTVALEVLPDRQRSVLVLHDVEGYTHGEIGTMLGIPEGTARSDLHHARASLRERLRDLWSER